MSDPTIYYMTHAGRAEESKFLLKHWERFGIPIVVCTPKNSEIEPTRHLHDAWGDCGPLGEPMYSRIIHILESFLMTCYSHALLVEFDCMCLLDRITFRNGLYGTPQLRYYDHALQFIAERYVTPPYMIDRKSALAMLDVARAYPDVQEGGHADRLLAALATLAGVPIMGYPEGSWSKLVNGPENLDTEMQVELGIAVRNGIKWFHFIKTKEQFDYVNMLSHK